MTSTSLRAEATSPLRVRYVTHARDLLGTWVPVDGTLREIVGIGDGKDFVPIANEFPPLELSIDGVSEIWRPKGQRVRTSHPDARGRLLPRRELPPDTLPTAVYRVWMEHTRREILALAAATLLRPDGTLAFLGVAKTTLWQALGCLLCLAPDITNGELVTNCTNFGPLCPRPCSMVAVASQFCCECPCSPLAFRKLPKNELDALNSQRSTPLSIPGEPIPRT